MPAAWETAVYAERNLKLRDAFPVLASTANRSILDSDRLRANVAMWKVRKLHVSRMAEPFESELVRMIVEVLDRWQIRQIAITGCSD
jgi:hypothetical protein